MVAMVAMVEAMVEAMAMADLPLLPQPRRSHHLAIRHHHPSASPTALARAPD